MLCDATRSDMLWTETEYPEYKLSKDASAPLMVGGCSSCATLHQFEPKTCLQASCALPITRLPLGARDFRLPLPEKIYTLYRIPVYCCDGLVKVYQAFYHSWEELLLSGCGRCHGRGQYLQSTATARDLRSTGASQSRTMIGRKGRRKTYAANLDTLHSCCVS